MTRTIWWGIMIVIIAGLLAAYLQNTRTQSAQDENTPAESQSAGIANPASTNCVNLGGTLEIVTEASGQYGLCHMKDGRVCEEWALFRDGSCTVPATPR